MVKLLTFRHKYYLMFIVFTFNSILKLRRMVDGLWYSNVIKLMKVQAVKLS